MIADFQTSKYLRQNPTIVTTMKNEGPFILEWLAYHRAIGVDDFLINTRVRIHNQNMTTAASAHADRKTLGHLS